MVRIALIIIDFYMYMHKNMYLFKTKFWPDFMYVEMADRVLVTSLLTYAIITRAVLYRITKLKFI